MRAFDVPLEERPEVFQPIRVDVAANVRLGMIDNAVDVLSIKEGECVKYIVTEGWGGGPSVAINRSAAMRCRGAPHPGFSVHPRARQRLVHIFILLRKYPPRMRGVSAILR
jgi:hypothetical protein